MDQDNVAWAQNIFNRLRANIETVIKGQGGPIRLVLAGMAGGGHILLEDNPGTGKTTLAKALAKSIDATFTRIQFTPDLLPSDILGVSIFDPSIKEFILHKGPIFTNILLADEINRASPRTQSALLESMAEHQVSIDGKMLSLDKPFFVIATQNPVESRGTYPLPEAQMDRFGMRLNLGYVNKSEEVRILSEQKQLHPIETLVPAASLEDILRIRNLVGEVYISEQLRQYIVELVSATRGKPGILLGASPRGSISLMNTACALALFDGLDYVTPDHIQESAVSVIAHRLGLESQARFSGMTSRKLVKEILASVPVPA